MRCACLSPLLAGCGVRNDARYCDPAKPCSDPAFPFCDAVAHECQARPLADLSVALDLSVEIDGGVLPDLTALEDLSGGDLTPLPDLTVLDDLTPPPDLRPQCISPVDCTDPAKPICDAVMQTCRACAAGDDAQCTQHGAGLRCKLADKNAGQCAQCNVNADCPSATPICNADGSCRKCRAHTECGGFVCELRAVGNNGTCIAGTDIAYVDNISVNCPGNGDVNTPYCQITTAVGTKTYVKVAPRAAHYNGLSFTTNVNQYFVGGTWASQPIIDANATGNHSIIVDPPANTTVNVTFDGFELDGVDGADNVACDSVFSNATSIASLTLTTCHLHDGTRGLNIDKCTANIGETAIYSTSAEGVLFDDEAVWNLHNAFIARCAGVGVQILSSNGSFDFNTVAFNGNVVNNPTSNLAGGVNCVAAATLNSSIVANNSKSSSGTGTQFGGSCTRVNVVTGPDTGAVAPSPAPAFVSNSDVHLKTSTPADETANRACCIDKIPVGGRSIDIDLQSRPAGVSNDIGADEAL